MAKKATPSGLTISRNKNKFTFKWKRNNSPDAQQLQWRQYYNKKWGAWHSVSIASDKKSAVIALDWANYYPTPKKQFLGIIQFRVRGKKNKKWSAWISKSLTFNVPDAPKVSVSHSTEDSNLTTFSWTTDVSDTSSKLYRNVEWQTCLQSGYNAKTIKATKNWSRITGYDSGTGSANSSKNVYEVSTNIATGSHTRWFRVRARGARGASPWAYSNHVYAAPYQASITSTTATRTGSGYRVTLKWTVNRGNSANPIDDVTVRYAMVVPDSNMSYPTGASWTDADVSIDVGRTGAATFETDAHLGDDEVLFVQVNTKHDTHTTYGIPTIVEKSMLSAPTNLSVSTNASTYTATVTATNNSTVPDSYLAVKYCPSSNPEGIVLGIIPHGQTTATVHCPDWSDEEAIAFEVYAVVGEYSAEGSPITEYRIDPDIWSVSISDGGAVPLAPTNVSAYPAQTIGTIQVRWDWAWEEANGAEISWSDHADAWESTDQPSTYDVTNMHSSQWNISELETGQTWYLKVRLFNKNGDDVTYGAYSELLTVDLSSAPLTPVMMLSAGVIPTDGSTTATWAYVSTDGTAQTYAEICEATFEDDEIVYGEIIASTQTAQHIDIYAEDVGWGAGEVHYICLRVQSASGKMSNEWSDPVPVTVAEPLECEITESSLIDMIDSVNGQPIEDNEPYQFRKTAGGVGVGDNLFDELVGGTVAWNQHIKNGNFADGQTSWYHASSTTVTVTDGVAKVEQTAQYMGFLQKMTDNPLITGHKYLLIADLKADSARSIQLIFGDNTNFTKYKAFSLTTNWAQCCYIDTITSNVTSGDQIFGARDAGASGFVPYYVRNANFVDLTQYFGSSTIADYVYTLETTTPGSGIAWLRKYYPKLFTYNPYNVGELISVNASSHDTVGKNQIYTTKNAYVSPGTDAVYLTGTGTSLVFRCIAGQTYTFSGITANRLVYGIFPSEPTNGQRTDYFENLYAVPMPTSFTTPIDGVCVLYVNNTVIDTSKAQIEFGSVVTEYEPYVKNTYPLDSSITLRGLPKIANGKLYYDGDTYRSDGLHTERFTLVDLGSITPTKYDVEQGTLFRFPIGTTIKKSVDTATLPNIICAKYVTVTNASRTNKTISMANNTEAVDIIDNDYSSASAIQTAMSGVYLLYERVTPTTSYADPFENPQECYSDGTEEYVTTNGVPVGHNTKYAPVGGLLREVKALTEMPLTVTVSGAGDAGTVNVIVERASDYFLERPDESEFVGYDGETVANVTRTGDGQLDIETSNLLGMLDDGANYRIVATVNDELGQSATDTLDFEVIWNHQALMPSATIALNGDIMEITPIEPDTAIAGDACDIYRLSVDKPQLIVSGASWGTKYVDPYPTIGDFGGYRIVFKSLYGDYITADNILAWTDYGKDENVYYFTPNAIVNFDGEQVELKYDLDVSYSWQKDFKETKYLGGSVRGDWNPGVSKTGTVNAISVVATDTDTLRAMRRLAEHSGICHVRTPEGSNFAADIQVSVASNVDTGHKIESFTLQITHVDGQGLDGLTYTEWAQGGI